MPALKKVFWVVSIFTLCVWVGVGIYYFKSTREDNEMNFVTPPRPTSEESKPTSEEGLNDFESLDQTHFVVGSFQGWEEIEGSDDRYVLLSNPETKRNYLKIKVVLQSNPYESHKFWEGMTAFSVEKTEEDHESLGYLKDFTTEEVDKLIKKEDLVKVVFERESMIEKFEEEAEELEAKDLKGKTDDYLALSVLIKRTEGKTAVEQQLGRKI